MFAGQGAQCAGMGFDLYQVSDSIKETFKEADNCLHRPLSEICFHGPQETLTDTANCQPAIYTVSLAAVQYFQERTGSNIKPVICGGLSLGEFAALRVSGTLSFRTGLNLLSCRGRLMAEACAETEGAMAAVLNADKSLVEEICRRCDIDVANYNSPGQMVISGEKEKVDRAVAELKENGVNRIIPLQVAGAFHSRLMSGAAREFYPIIDKIDFKPPLCPVVQNAVGTPVTAPEELKKNIQMQVDHSVYWEDCARVMMKEADALLEFGPGSALSGFIRKIDRKFPVFPAGTVEEINKAIEKL